MRWNMQREHYTEFLILVFATALVFFGFGIADAQSSETFDITTFQPPKAWNRQAGADAVQFSTEDKATGTFCLITVFKSVPGLGSSLEDFNVAWQAIVKEAVTVSGAPQMFPSDAKGEWVIASGLAEFEKNGEKGVAVLYTASGYGKMISALVLTNTQAYEANITAFMASVILKKPETGTKVNGVSKRIPSPQTTDSFARSNRLTQDFWKQTQNRRDAGGYAGYSSNTYQFFSNNTYKFSQVTFQNYAPKYYLENEEGTYKVTGNKITITPKKAIFSSHKSKKEDPPIKSGNLGLEVRQYSFEFMDLHNNGRWSLLLSPIDGIETKRDGGFSFWLNGEKRKTYSYAAVNAAGELVP